MYWFYTCDPYKYTISGVRLGKIVTHIPPTAYVCPAAYMGFVSSCHKTLEWKSGQNVGLLLLSFWMGWDFHGCWTALLQSTWCKCCYLHWSKNCNIQATFPCEFWSKLSFMIVRQVPGGIGSISIGGVGAFAAWMDTGRQADSWILLVSYGATEVIFQSNIR